MADMITIQEQNKEELQRAILVGVCLDSDNSDYLHAMEELRELAKACKPHQHRTISTAYKSLQRRSV